MIGCTCNADVTIIRLGNLTSPIERLGSEVSDDPGDRPSLKNGQASAGDVDCAKDSSLRLASILLVLIDVQEFK